MKPLLTPIVLCGYGSNLYPLCDATDSVSSSSKALLPIVNRPMLAFTLQSLVSAGFASCIVLAPSNHHTNIIRSLSDIRLACPQSTLIPSERKRTKESKDEKLTMSIVFEDPTLTAAINEGGAAPSSVQNASMQVDLLPLGPHDGNNPNNRNTGIKDRFRLGPLGTAELLRWLDAIGKLEGDPLVLPVDLVAPSFPIRDLIDAFVQAQAQKAEKPTICCALYERGAGEGVGREREREGPARLISAFAVDSQGISGGKKAVHPLLFLRDSDLNQDIHIRRSLLRFSPRSRISTRLLDAHTYILNKEQVMPLLEANPSLTSLSDHLLPLIAKASWQPGMRQKANWDLSALTVDDVGADIDDLNSNGPLHHSQTLPVEEKQLQEQVIARSAGPVTSNLSRKYPSDELPVQCLTIIVRLDDAQDKRDGISSAGTLPPFVARANTVATYLECNRWLLKALHGSTEQQSFHIPELVQAGASSTSTSTSANPPSATANNASQVSSDTQGIAPSAQISTDSILGNTIQLGERASIKRSCIGTNCEIGRGARLAGCVLMDGVVIGENVRLENVICCSNSRIGDRSTLKDCDVAGGVVIMPDTNAKNEKLAGDRDSDDESDELEDDE